MKLRHLVPFLAASMACGDAQLTSSDELDDVSAAAGGMPAWLVDSEPAAPTWFNPLFPRITTTGAFQALDGMKVPELLKFTAVSGSPQNDLLERLHAQNPAVLRLRYMSARAYQTPRSSMPLAETYPGHFLMNGHTRVRAALTSSNLDVAVEDIDALDPGADVMIWERAADGSFVNVEHATVRSIDRAARTVRLGERGFQVGGKGPHPVGAFIASHMNGAVISPHYWAYNFSTMCPLDAEGRRFNQVFGRWVASHLNDAFADDGTVVGTFDSYDGVLWDISGDSISTHADCDLDGIEEGGVSVEGDNAWGAGMERLFVVTRDELARQFPGRQMVQSGGTTATRGYGQLTGTQLEGFPFIGPPQDPTPDYASVDEVLGQYNMFMHHLVEAPVFTECRNKTPNQVAGGGASNAPYRFALGLTLIDDGVFSEEKSERDWMDEFAVTPEGDCVGPSADEETKQKNTGWLGRPLAPYRRLITFDASMNAVTNPGFELDLSGWSATGATLTRVVGDQAAGLASMKAKPDGYQRHVEDISVGFAPVSGLEPGLYTVSFAVRGTQERSVEVTLGGKRTTRYVVPTTWVRRNAVLDVPASGVAALELLLGGPEKGAVLIDAVHVTKGDADLFKRDFEHGTVVVNGTTVPQTVLLIPGKYKRLRGTQDGINDGADVDSVTVAPRDAALLITR